MLKGLAFSLAESTFTHSGSVTCSASRSGCVSRAGMTVSGLCVTYMCPLQHMHWCSGPNGPLLQPLRRLLVVKAQMESRHGRRRTEMFPVPFDDCDSNKNGGGLDMLQWPDAASRYWMHTGAMTGKAGRCRGRPDQVQSHNTKSLWYWGHGPHSSRQAWCLEVELLDAIQVRLS